MDYDDNRVDGAMSNLGDYLDNRDVRRRYAATALIGANYAASKGYEGGELWSKLFQMMRARDTDSNREAFSELFRAGLAQYKLERFTHPAWTNIGEMILHAGITLNSLPKFASRLVKAFDNDRNISGQQFNEDIREIPEERVSSSSLDKPTWHFIRQAGEIADDFVDRLISILDDLSNGKDPEHTYGIPPRVAEEFIEISRELLDARRTNNPRLTRRIGKPIVRWHDVGTGNELRILFPELENIFRTSTQWQVTSTDIDVSITTYPSISGARAVGSYFTVSEPRPIVYLTGTYKANAINQGESRSWGIPLYESQSWLMVFNEEGFIQSADGSLQPGVYTLLWPNKVGQNDVKVIYDSVEHQPSSIPEGWTNNSQSGWQATRVAFKGADSIKVFVGEKLIKTQFVTGLKKPAFEYGQLLVQDTYSESGNQVLCALPNITFPPTGTSENTWKISVREANGKEIYNDTFASTSIDTYAFESDVLSGKSGEFKVSVSSKRLGQGIKQSFVIASDLRVQSSPSSRYIDRNNSGLDVCNVTIEKGGKKTEIRLTNTDVTYQLDDPNICDQVLTIRPRCESIELFNKASGNRSEWFSTARCHIEDIQNVELTVNYLGSESPELLAVWSPSDALPLYSPAINGKRKFNLSELQDAVLLKGAFKVYSHSVGQDPLEILNCFNKKIFASYSFNRESCVLGITFANGNIPKDLRVTIFSKNAYWREPFVVKNFTGEVQLPDDLVGLGPVICEIDIADPFLNSSIQEAPSFGQNTFEVDISIIESSFSPESLVVSWLDSNSKPDALSDIDVSLAWSLLSKSPYLQDAEKVNVLSEVQSFAKRKLSADSARALESYPLSFANNESWFNNLVSLGFIISPAVADASKFNQLLSKPFLSLLFSACTQDQKSFEETFSQAKRNWGLVSSTSANELSSNLSNEALATIKLKAKQLSFAMNSSIVHPFVLEAGKSAFENYIRDNNLPPGRHFDPGSLATLFKLVLERNRTIFNALSNRFPNAKIMNELAYKFQTLDSSLPASYQELTSTRPILNKEIVEGKAGFEPRPPLEGTKGYLVNLPALSMRFAMLARLSARGFEAATDVLKKKDLVLPGISLIKLYQTLCNLLPELCERDLVLAELFLQAESIKNERN